MFTNKNWICPGSTQPQGGHSQIPIPGDFFCRDQPLLISQNLATTCTGITVKWCTHMPIHSIWRCSITLYTFNMDVGCSQWWFIASSMTSQCHLGPALPQFFKIWPHLQVWCKPGWGPLFYQQPYLKVILVKIAVWLRDLAMAKTSKRI